MRIVHPEDPHAVAHPVPDDAQHLRVEALGVVVEVQREDVLVLLRRVLGVGDRAVSPGGEPFRMLAHPWMIRRGLQRQVKGDLQAKLVCPGHERVEVRQGAQVRVNRVMPAGRRADGDPGSPGSAVSELLAPLRPVLPIGWTGGRYTTSKPIAAMASSLRAAVRSVPETGRRPGPPVFAPSDRGKNSYHAPYRARSRCTTTGYAADEVSRSRSGNDSRTAVISSLSAAASRSRGGICSSPRVRASARRAALACCGLLAAAGPGRRGACRCAPRCSAPRGARTPAAARSNSRAPSAKTSGTSWPSGILIAASWRHPATGSPQACTRKCHRPSQVTVTWAAYLSVPSATSRIRTGARRLPPGSCRMTSAPRSSWPSLKIVALTSNDSPVTALAGHRPHATSGCTSRIGILPITLDKLPSHGPAAPGGPGYSGDALGSLSVKAIRRLTVRPALPEALAPLNLRWSWHRETQELFAAIDPEGWQRTGDPAELLAGVAPERLSRLAGDASFLDRLRRAVADLEDYLTRAGWYQRLAGTAGTEAPPRCVAYFSPEFGNTAALPQYSGGLGILAGDHLKACSDLGVPLIGVGLLYRHGYFAQSLSADGWQAEHYPAEDPNGLPLTLLRDPAGAPARVTVGLADDASVTAQLWVAQVGRVPLLLLDSYVEENEPALREVTDRLYGGGSEHRLRQELLLGVGGVRAVRAFCQIMEYPEPEVFHTNEGHAGFLGLERIREYLRQGLSYEASLELCRAGTVFTTHTPVPAGIDRFDRDLVARQFAGEAAGDGLTPERILALGAETFPGGDPGVFNMAVMGMRLAQRVNGVSGLHGEVSRAMFAGLWPGFDTAEVPIGSITNGVHAPTWVAHEIADLAGPPAAGHREPGDPEAGPAGGSRRGGAETGPEGGGRRSDPAADGAAEAARWDEVASDPARICALRRRLVEEARRRLRESWHQRGASDPELTWIDTALDENILTIGFARRVPSYKRLTMMLHDKARLRALLLDPQRPVQVVVAGKAHPADEGGKRLIRELVEFADDPEVRHRIVFLPDYDMALARSLVQGCDVWLNNPLRPLEACGTSGMKSALNGGLNLSILDGWWDEWYDGRNGWAIPSADRVADPHRRDEIEAAGLYDLLGRSVAPLFYERDADGLPRGWLEMVAHALRGLGPRVQATRMVREYVTELYRPAARSSRLLAAGGFGGARELAGWQERVAKAWPGVRVELVEGADGELSPGTPLTVRASVALGDLSPEDVAVQVVYGRAGETDEIADPEISELSPEPGTADSGAIRYSGVVQLGRPGPFGYTVRVLPSHPLLADPAEMGLVSMPAPPSGMSDGDLR